MRLSIAESLALELMDKHGLLDEEREGGPWKFEWSRGTRTFGQTIYGTKVIKLSKPYTKINEMDNIQLTILHEIAHVLAGAGHHHNYHWQKICREIGGNGRRLATGHVSPKSNRIPSYMKPIKDWKGECPNGHQYVRRMRRRPANTRACSPCCRKFNEGKYDEKYLVTWQEAI